MLTGLLYALFATNNGSVAYWIALWLALSAAMPHDWPAVLNYFMITLILSLTGWAQLARVVRGRFLSLRTEDFVIAARLDGVSDDERVDMSGGRKHPAFALADGEHRQRLATELGGEPAGRDPDAVTGHLRGGAVRVPDGHSGAGAVAVAHLDHAVRADPGLDRAEPPHARRRQRARVRLHHDEVAIAERVPLRELHRPPPPGSGCRQR